MSTPPKKLILVSYESSAVEVFVVLISKTLDAMIFFMFRNSLICAGSSLEQNFHDDHNCKVLQLAFKHCYYILG